MLDDGRMLVSGGFTGIANNNVIIRIIFDTVDVYDPGIDRWSVVPPEDRRSFANGMLKLPDGSVLFVGVDEDSTEEHATGAAYGLDTIDLSWRQLADPPTARAFPRMVLMGDGRVMVAGGFDVNAEPTSFLPESTNNVDIFDPAANTWQQAAPMSAISENLWLFSLNDGRVLAIAGEDQPSSASTVHVQIYDPDSDSWVVVDSHDPYYLPTGAVQLSDGRVLIAGTLKRSKTTLTETTGDGELVQVELLDGRRYYGDRIREVFPDAKVYDPATDTWTATLGSLGGQTPGSLILLGNGRVLLAGGEDSGEDDFTGGYEFTPRLSSTTAVYDPDSNFWSPGPSLSEGRSDHSAVLMPDGRVVLLGGIGLTEVGEDREEAVPLNTMEFIDSMAIPRIDPAAVTMPESEEDLCEIVPIPAPSADLAPAGESPSPRDILSAAHAAMSALDSYHAKSRWAIVDDQADSGYAICERVAIDFQVPDQVRADLSIYENAGEFSFQFISIGDTTYVTDLVTGEWEINSYFMPENYTDPLVPISDDAIADLSDVSVEGVERLNGADVYRIAGTLSLPVFLETFARFPGSDEFEHPRFSVVYWVGVDDSLVRRVSAEGVIQDEDFIPLSSSATLEYSAFGEEIVIEAPEVGAAS